LRERHDRLPALEVREPAAEGIRPASNRDPFLIDISIIQVVWFGFFVGRGGQSRPRHLFVILIFSFLLTG
jgi:hypothetical protein